jgi:hypothetical protein
MPATVRRSSPFRAALVCECQAEFRPRLAVLLQVARSYGHALECPNCRRYYVLVAKIFESVARHVGEIMRGWYTLGVDQDEVIAPQESEVALLLEICRSAATRGVDSDSENDWRVSLGLSGLSIARSSRGPARGILIAITPNR